MKSKSKKLIIIIITVLILLLGTLIFFFKFDFKNSNVLTLEENKWIDKNKYNVIDIAILNDIPILSYDGEGIVYNCLDYITQTHSLKFNVVPYKLDVSLEYDYQMSIVDEKEENQIELLKDNMVLLTLNNLQYSDINEINNMRIGVLTSDKEMVSNYLNNDSITYVEYNNYNDLKNSLINSKNAILTENPVYDVDGIIILKATITKEIIENDFNISYHFNDLNKYFVLNTSGNNHLNSILKKSFNEWKQKNYIDDYNHILLNQYYKFEGLSDVEQKTLKSKNYVYGFINYGIYNYLDDTQISGLNAVILKEFNKFSGISITYTQYNSLSKLLKDFNNKKVDFIFDVVDESRLKTDIYKTANVFDKKLVIASDINSNIVVDNLHSLKNKEILTLKDSYLEKYLEENKIKFKSYNSVKDMVNDFDSKDIIAIDLENYNYYKTSALKNSRINYILDMDDNYNFIVSNKESNVLFEKIFNFYITYNSMNDLITKNYADIAYQNSNLTYILTIIVLVLVLYVVLDFINHIKVMIKTLKQSKKIKLTKEEKIMYIDQLTSLKNRAYLNSRIESWDDSEVYPQSIIIIDLNNISYVNDNYGREEGDKVITEAANILIQHQLSNSEIIRTDGNEFLIYLVGYTEKQVISYLRKLSKEFKNLSHGFGAASGYSIITDAIKTIDDAVNEATLAMKENKEDTDY